MKKILLVQLLLLLGVNNISSQTLEYVPFKIGNEVFSIGSYMYKRNTLSASDIEEKYNIINDSIVFTFNNVKRKVYISFDYGIGFKSINYSDFFGSASDSYYIESLKKDKDNVYINLFSDNVNDLTNKVFVYETKNPDLDTKYLLTSNATEVGQLITLKFCFNNILIGSNQDDIYIWKNTNWEKINTPVKNYVIQTYVSEDYFYAFFSDKVRGKNILNNSCYRTKDLINWEKIENFNFKYGQLHYVTIFENKIFFNKKSVFDITQKQLIEDNIIVKKFNDSGYDFNMNICNEKLYICDTHEFPRVKLFEYKNDELDEILIFNSDVRLYKFYYSNMFGIFCDNGIYYFDIKLLSKRIKAQKDSNNINPPEKTKTYNIALPALNLKKN
jgi:hypothetical protein